MLRKIIAVVGGIAGSLLVVGFFAPALPTILPSISCFVGGFIAGGVVRERGAVYGLLVSLIIFVALILSLIFISYQYSSGKFLFPPIIGLIPNLVAILFGLAGGYLGERVSLLHGSRSK